MKLKTIFFVFLSLVFAQCSRDDEDLLSAGIETKVLGKLTDYQNAPIPNAKLKIGEFKQEWHNQSVYGGNYIDNFVQYLDSIETNSNGEYNFTFKTSGQGNVYKLMLQNSPLNEQKYWSCCMGFIDIENIGKTFTFNTIQLINLYPCDVTFNLNSISNFPLFVDHDTTKFENNRYEINSNLSVLKRFYISKYSTQTIKIFRDKNGIKQKATYTFPASNLETLTTQSITINEADFINI